LKEGLDQVSAFVGLGVMLGWRFAARPGWDDRVDAALVKSLAQPVGIVSLVGDRGSESEPLDQRADRLDLTTLARQQDGGPSPSCRRPSGLQNPAHRTTR
jgi:hypothetical protein